ncbi:MAG: C10 family peptidase [Kiritimatiellae bacterium]|nr:C10 family peptidase [Kiritimatiellia bacterium]
MKKISISWTSSAIAVAALFFPPAISNAAEVSLESAKTAAQAWINLGYSMDGLRGRSAADGETLEADNAKMHVVSLDGGGFVVMGADDLVQPVIAFSPTGNLRKGDCNSPLLDILKADIAMRTRANEPATPARKVRLLTSTAEEQQRTATQRQWDRLLSEGARTSSSAKGSRNMLKSATDPAESVSDVRVEPFVKSMWGQENNSIYINMGTNCYNYYTPSNYPCGCVATTLAQIMRYHEYPKSVKAKTKGCKVRTKNAFMTMFGGEYDYDSMPLIPEAYEYVPWYAGGATETQLAAIGKLTYDCGVAMRMWWDEEASSSGGAGSASVLIEDFGYKNAIVCACEKDLKDESFRNRIVCSNLDAGLPVILGFVGHIAFADGYGYSDGTLYTHVNLGWSGEDNVWYALPYITTADGQYESTMVESVIYNIFPETNGEIVSGRVTDEEGTPLPNVDVAIFSADSDEPIASTATSESGIYAFVVDADKSYTVKATGYSVSAKATTTRSASSSVTLDVGMCWINDAGKSVACGNSWGCDMVINVKSAAPPMISPNGGIFYPNTLVTISCATDGAVIKYTTDGTDPTEESEEYCGPFEISSSVTVKARAFKEDLNCSIISEATFERDAFIGFGLGSPYTLWAGLAPDLSDIIATVAENGWTLTVSGLPQGIAYDAPNRRLSGIAAKEGRTTVTFTARKDGKKKVVTAGFNVLFPKLSADVVDCDGASAPQMGKVTGAGSYPYGKKVALKATANAGFAFCGYYLDGELVDESRNAALSLEMPAEDLALEARFATLADDAKAIALEMDGHSFENPSDTLLTNVMCGISLQWPVAATALSATTVKVAGLPSGLKFAAKDVVDSKTKEVLVPANTIYGAPSAASKVDAKTGHITPSEVKITVTTAGKSTKTYVVRITVDPLPSWAVGNFEGSVASRGVATMSITAAGKISGKIALDGTNWTFKADSFTIESETTGTTNLLIGLSATAGKITRDLALALTDFKAEYLSVDSATGAAAGSFGSDDTTLYRIIWSDKSDAFAAGLVATYAGAYSFSAGYGNASCEIAFALDEKGAVKGSADIPDGAKSRKASFSANALAEPTGLHVVVAIPPDAKKGYPAVFKDVNLVAHHGENYGDNVYRDPGIVATIESLTQDSGATGKISMTPKYGQVAAGKDVSLTAKADKGFVFSRWVITGGDAKIPDPFAATIKLRMDGMNDIFITAQFVTAQEDKDAIGLEVDSSNLNGAASGTANAPVNRYCGVALDWPIVPDGLSKTTVKVAGLPAGLKLVQNKTTGEYSVTGVPTTASKVDAKTGAVTPSKVVFTVTTAGKSSETFSFDFQVNSLPAWAVGNFYGTAWDADANAVGAIQALTVSPAGKISGKMLVDNLTWALTASSYDSTEDGIFLATVIGKNGKAMITNVITVASSIVDTDLPAIGEVSCDEWSAWQNLWKRADTKTSMPVFKRDFKVEQEDGLVLTFKKDGVVSFANGATKVSGTSQLVKTGKGYQVMTFAPPKVGSDGLHRMFSVGIKVDEQNSVTECEAFPVDL